MNNVSEQLLSAIDIVTDEKISKLNYDKTIKAQIYSIENLDTGEYKVKYSGNIFSVYSSDISKQYSIGDSVYVTVPEGNFSNKKVILSLVSEQSLSYSQIQALQQSINEVSPTFDKFYIYNKGNIVAGSETESAVYGVVAGAEAGTSASQVYIYKGADKYSSTQYHGQFQQYANNYELIQIKGSFLTTLQSEHTKGNYGIEIEFYTNEDKVVSFKLDLSSFNGAPYQFTVYTPQSVILKAQTNYLLGLKSIKLFEENFEYDKYVVNGSETNKQNTTEPNIFVKNVEVCYVEEKDLTENLYYLNIQAPKGNSITSSVSSIDLRGQLIYQGESIMDSTNCECKWFKRDLSVMIGSDAYDKEAGFGWKAVEKTNNQEFNLLTLDSNDIFHESRYKLVVTYKETTTLSAEITVYNLNSSYDYEIQQITSGDTIKLQLINNKNDVSLFGDWYLSYPDGSYLEVTNGKKQSSIKVNNYLLYSSVTFYCAVYGYDRTTIIGTLEQTIVNSKSEEDLYISYDGEDNFRYDANGDVTFEDSEKERTLSVVLTWKEGTGNSYKIEWLSPDGEKISTGTKLQPPNSMFENLWVDNTNILHYTIKQKYNINSNNNTLKVRIVTIDEQIYTFDKEILFLKDGDQGTNGTTYITAIRPCDSDGNKLSGLHPLIYNNGWKNSLSLKCYVYRNGELLNNNSSYSLTYKWEEANVTLSAKDTNQVVVKGQGTINSESTSANLEFFVKVQVTITDKADNKKTYIYAFYPIDVAVGGIDYSKVDISSIPSYIKYTTSGLNPSFYSNNITFLYNSKDISSNSTILSLNTSILNIEQDGNLFYLKPANSFIYENTSSNDSNIGILQLKCTDSQYILHPIVMYLDAYGNEAINGWDGTQVSGIYKLDDSGSFIKGRVYYSRDDNGYYTQIALNSSTYKADTYYYQTGLLAPQIGAGEKDSYNRFTGVVMGKDSGQEKIGLYGYQNGVNTFGLMQDGKAYFGAKSGGGQITIDGTSGVIHGGDVTVKSNGTIQSAPNGMYIRLSDKAVAGDVKAIGVGYSQDSESSNNEENFYVTYDGKLKATGADIQGTIYATEGQIGGTGRSGGWSIQTGKIFSGSGLNYVELNSNSSDTYAIQIGGSISSSAKFLVTKTGALTAKEGTIGGWKILSNRLTSSNGKIGLASSGANGYRIWVNADSLTGNETENTNPSFSSGTYFWIDSSGKMSCEGAEIRGTIYADEGEIGGWTINSNGLSANNISLSSTQGIKIGSTLNLCQTTSYYSGDNIGLITSQNSGGKIVLESKNAEIAVRGRGGSVYISADGQGTSDEPVIGLTAGVYSNGRWNINSRGTITFSANTVSFDNCNNITGIYAKYK